MFQRTIFEMRSKFFLKNTSFLWLLQLKWLQQRFYTEEGMALLSWHHLIYSYTSILNHHILLMSIHLLPDSWVTSGSIMQSKCLPTFFLGKVHLDVHDILTKTAVLNIHFNYNHFLSSTILFLQFMTKRNFGALTWGRLENEAVKEYSLIPWNNENTYSQSYIQ